MSAVCIRIVLASTWYACSPQVDDIVLDKDPAPSPLTGHSPQFLANVRCGQTAGWTKMPLGMKVGLSPGDFVFDGDPAPSPKGTAPNQFLTHVYCGQTVGYIKMPLGTEVNFGRGDVLDGGHSCPQRGTAAQFSAHVYCV